MTTSSTMTKTYNPKEFINDLINSIAKGMDKVGDKNKKSTAKDLTNAIFGCIMVARIIFATLFCLYYFIEIISKARENV